MGNCCGQDSRDGKGELPENLKFDDNQYLAMVKITEDDKRVKKTVEAEAEADDGDEEYKMNEVSEMIDGDQSLQNHEIQNLEQLQHSPIEFQYLKANSPNKSEVMPDNSYTQIQKSDSQVKDEVIFAKRLTIKEEDPIVKAREQQKLIEQRHTEMMEYYQLREHEIIKIQALQRGRIIRKYSEEIKKDQKVYLTQKQQANAPISKAAKSLEKKVVVNNILQKYIEEYGRFNPDKPECKKNLRVQKILKENKDIVTLSAYTFENHKGIYIGEWKQGLRHGQGKFILDNQIYEGFWEENYACGYGRTIFINGDMYEGEYFNDQAQGYGVYIARNKNKYEGQWSNNKPHGYGKESWNDGSRFIGTFSMGKKQGEGKFHFRDGSVYQGNFENNLFSGKGKYTWPDGREYDGMWKNNVMDGQGVYTWPDGRKFTGTYVKGSREGTGYFNWPKGEAFQGQWKFGHQHGVGYYTDEKKKTRKGVWKFGKFQRYV